VKGVTKVDYRAEDLAGNVAIKSIDVTVTNGTRPTIVLNGPSHHIWPQGLPYVDPMATIEDPREHNLNDRLESDAQAAVDVGVTGAHLVTYRMSSPDIQGLYANLVYRVVDVRAGDGLPVRPCPRKRPARSFVKVMARKQNALLCSISPPWSTDA
jgi:hypothetical protein